MKQVKSIIETIDELVDHYTPYRPLTDSSEMKGARQALLKLKWRIEND